MYVKLTFLNDRNIEKTDNEQGKVLKMTFIKTTYFIL